MNQNKKFRSINTLNKAYIERVAPCAAAGKLLVVAGFERAEGTETLQLTHSNSAVLTLISQVKARLVVICIVSMRYDRYYRGSCLCLHMCV